MSSHAQKLFRSSFASLHPFYVQKAERKGRTKAEVDRIIAWLTGYSAEEIERRMAQGDDVATFFGDAPAIAERVPLVVGVVCGVRVEEVDDPLMRRIRCLDKLIDELAKGRAMEKILRA
jgi:hypothetical protein